MNQLILSKNPSGRVARRFRMLSAILALLLAFGIFAGAPQASYGASAKDKIVKISAGAAHCLALTADGRVFSWGDNSSGQLGDGTSGTGTGKPIPSPIDPDVFGGKAVRDIEAGPSCSFAITVDNNVYAWGNNVNGGLGVGDTVSRDVPVRVSAFDSVGVTKIVAGAGSAFALTSTGKLYAWGLNQDGQLGLGDTANRNVPVPVSALDSEVVTSVAAGLGKYILEHGGVGHSLAVTASGKVYAWGDNYYGQLGTGDTASRLLPVQLSAFDGKNIKSVSAGQTYSMALGADGSVYAWGLEVDCALGIGTTILGRNSVTLPTPVSELDGKGIQAISAGGRSSYALDANGYVYAWGQNSSGTVGNGTVGNETRPLRLKMPNGKKIMAVSGGGNVCIALTADGKIFGWGILLNRTAPLLVDLSLVPSDDSTEDTPSGGNGGSNNGPGTDGKEKDVSGGVQVNPVAHIAGFGVTQKTVYVKRGKTVKLPYAVYATAEGKQYITWKASKKNVATVSKGKATGKLKVSGNADAKLTIKAGKKTGSGKITLTSANGQKLVITVKVVKGQKKVASKSVKIKKLTQKAAKRMKPGQVKTLKAAFTKKATAIATWKSSNTKVAKIDAAGKLTTIAKGTAKITLKVGGKKKVLKITVK